MKKRTVIFYLTMAVTAILVVGLILTYRIFRNDGSRTAENTDKEAEVIRILSVYEQSNQQELLNRLAAGYEELHPEIRVELQWVDEDDLKKEIGLDSGDGTSPDIVICSSMEMPGLINMDMLEELTPELESLVSCHPQYPEQWQSAMNNGKVYGIPFTLDPYVLFCNQSDFEKRKLDYPQTWDELLEVCRKSERSGFTDIGAGIRRSNDAAIFFGSLLYSCGGNFYTLDKESGQSVLNILNTMKKWGYISKNVINCTPKDMAGEFAAGKLSMLIGPLSLASCIREENDSLKFQVCPIPSQIRPGCLILGDNIGLIRGSKEEARDFVRFLYTRESRLEIQKGMGTLPLWQEDEESVVLEEAHRELYEVFQEQGSVPSAYSSWFELSDVVSEYVYEVLIRTNVDLKSIAGMLQDEVRVAIMRN